jgi:uncharacterized protein (TIGR03066 family)
MVLTPVLYVALLAPAFADKPAELIVGKWSAKEKMGDMEVEMVLEFTKDGVIKATFGSQSKEGKYKVIDDDKLEVTVERDGKEETKKGTFKVTKDKLVLVPEGEGEKEFTRVK